MLQLAFTHTLARDGRTLTLADVTPAYAAGSAPGGYGGLNPTLAQLVLAVVVGRQRPGTLQFDATVYANPGSPFQFTLPGDGLYHAWVLAFLKGVPIAPAPGQGWANAANVLYYQPRNGGAPLALDTTRFSFEQLRDFDPELVVAGETIVPVLVTQGSSAAVDRLLLEYARQGSRNRPQLGQEFAHPWLHAQATLDSIGILYEQSRYPEAAAQLAALQNVLANPSEQDILTRPIHTDWVQEATNPGRQ